MFNNILNHVSNMQIHARYVLKHASKMLIHDNMLNHASDMLIHAKSC